MQYTSLTSLVGFPADRLTLEGISPSDWHRMLDKFESELVLLKAQVFTDNQAYSNGLKVTVLILAAYKDMALINSIMVYLTNNGIAFRYSPNIRYNMPIGHFINEVNWDIRQEEVSTSTSPRHELDEELIRKEWD